MAEETTTTESQTTEAGEQNTQAAATTTTEGEGTQGQAAGDKTTQTPPDEAILGKFKDVDALKKGYTELEKAYHAKAPKEYAVDMIEDDNFKLNREDPIFKEFTTAAKAANLTQAQAEAMLGVYKKDILSKTLNAQDEIKKLGADGQEQVNTVRNFLSNNLSKQNFDAFAPLISNASFVRAIQELRSKLRAQHVPGSPPGGHNGAPSQETRDTWMRENWEKLKANDPVTLKQFDEIFKDA